METPAFLTGSHAYGTPTALSDIDLVVYVPDKKAHDFLWGKTEGDCDDDDYPTIQFGKLNLVACFTLKRYDTWLQVTNELIEQKPVSREDAIKAFQAAFKREE